MSMDPKATANLLFEISSLRKVARAHRAVLLSDDLSDNISSHSFLVTWISYILAKHENADITKVLLMALVHDVPEARTGDLAWINKRYVKAFEDEAIAGIFHEELELNEFVELSHEYHERKTLEAQVVKDADRIAQIISLKEYVFAYNNQQAKEWVAEVTPEWVAGFFTETGRDLMSSLMNTAVNEWTTGLATEQRR